ncbi:MAG: hypothetical protein KIT14_20775 [bacterium]|nr:hypothetical protein [bacterium]
MAASCRPGTAGFSFIELLVSLGVVGVVMTGMVQFFGMHAHEMREHGFRVEAQQALRGALDAITRDVRLAGACLPTDGAYVALDGTNDPSGDSITVRTGLVRSDLTCVTSPLAAPLASGGTQVSVSNADGFIVGKMAFVRRSDGSGELRRVTAVNTGGNTVTLSAGVTQPYGFPGSSLYAVDQRTYSLRADVEPPLLMFQIDQEPPQPFAAGVTRLDFRYVLNQNCPTCTVVDLSSPLPAATWWLVNEVLVTMTVQTVGGVVEADSTELTQTARTKPRNLL